MAILLRNASRILRLLTVKYTSVNPSVLPGRHIMTTRPRLEKALDNLQKNPYFGKYAQKIAKLQQTNPEEFLQRIEEQEKKQLQEKEKRNREKNIYESQAKPNLQSTTQTQAPRLDAVMKVDMIQDKSKEEIIEIWKEYHKQKDCICGTMTPEQYDKMFERGNKYPIFLLPLPRDHGYEFIVIQFAGTEIHMTPLLWYQTHKENAPECLTMVHYNELRDSHGVVLMRGEFDKKVLNVQEAQCLANELQLYYATDNSHRQQLLETFTNKPDEFKHMDVIAQLETISLEVPNKN